VARESERKCESEIFGFYYYFSITFYDSQAATHAATAIKTRKTFASLKLDTFFYPFAVLLFPLHANDESAAATESNEGLKKM